MHIKLEYTSGYGSDGYGHYDNEPTALIEELKRNNIPFQLSHGRCSGNFYSCQNHRLVFDSGNLAPNCTLALDVVAASRRREDEKAEWTAARVEWTAALRQKHTKMYPSVSVKKVRWNFAVVVDNEIVAYHESEDRAYEDAVLSGYRKYLQLVVRLEVWERLDSYCSSPRGYIFDESKKIWVHQKSGRLVSSSIV